MESEIFFYHLIPEDLRGLELMPLNELKAVYPDLFAKYYKKYEGRETLTHNEIPILNCLWNDVVMFCPVPPHKVKEELAAAGHKRGKWRWFQFPYNCFNPDKLVLLAPTERLLSDHVIPKESFRRFTIEECRNHLEVTELTKAYYRTIEPGQLVLVWWQLPHILYKGRVPIEYATIIEA